MTALVAIIGRPNVGKSTLFNRLVGKRLALVDDQPGVTRDRRYAAASLGGMDFTLIDTAGMERAPNDALETRMLKQTQAAIAEADVCLLMIDARVGVTSADEYFAQMVRRSGKTTILLLNKAEGKAGVQTAYDAYALGLGEPLLISAEHGEGFGDFFTALQPYVEPLQPYVAAKDSDEEFAPKKKKKVRAAQAQKNNEAARRKARETPVDEDADLFEDSGEDEATPMQIAIVGRPNAGKSTLINALLGQDRLLTGPEAGITRDSIAVDFNYDGRNVKLVDTAGMRRKANVVEKLETMSVGDSLRAIRYAHVVVVLMDATIPFEKQDNAITALIEREGRAVVIGLSKWDLVGLDPDDVAAASEGTAKRIGPEQRARQKLILEELRLQCDEHLAQIKGVPLVTLSATEGRGLNELMQACFDIYTLWNKRIPTAQLNRFLDDAENTHTPPMVSGRRVKMKYITQVKSRPPTFQLFTNIADDFPESYARYLVNGLRHVFEMKGIPIRLMFKASSNPYEGKRKRQS